MIDQIKNTPAKISLYDLISTLTTHKDVLYALFKNEIVPTNISTTNFFKKFRTIKECDAISFYKYEKLTQALLEECSTLYIIPMVYG